jgi:hypothetical protein
MRKVVGYLLMSLDGVVEEPDDWMKDFDEDMRDNMVEVINAQDVFGFCCKNISVFGKLCCNV